MNKYILQGLIGALQPIGLGAILLYLCLAYKIDILLSFFVWVLFGFIPYAIFILDYVPKEDKTAQ